MRGAAAAIGKLGVDRLGTPIGRGPAPAPTGKGAGTVTFLVRCGLLRVRLYRRGQGEADRPLYSCLRRAERSGASLVLRE
jgi:hypothetical protein